MVYCNFFISSFNTIFACTEDIVGIDLKSVASRLKLMSALSNSISFYSTVFAMTYIFSVSAKVEIINFSVYYCNSSYSGYKSCASCEFKNLS